MTIPKRAWILFPKDDPGSPYAVTVDETEAKEWDEGDVHEFVRRCPSRSGPLRCERAVHASHPSATSHRARCGAGTAEWADEPKTKTRKRATLRDLVKVADATLRDLVKVADAHGAELHVALVKQQARTSGLKKSPSCKTKTSRKTKSRKTKTRAKKRTR